MANENGGKSKIIYYLLALLQAIVLAWVWKTDGNVAASTTKIAVLDANYTNITGELKDIKSDLRLILRKLK